MAIRSWKHKGLRELFETGKTAKIARRHHRVIVMILDLLDNIHSIKDCIGVKDFHELKGDRAGAYAMRISRNYRITFRWDGKDVYDVNFE
ncbi:MAG: type II toxin-antitoxin system RelE/ParE family toxin, partial [Candidatus Aenigmatarchaeota archaeon]